MRENPATVVNFQLWLLGLLGALLLTLFVVKWRLPLPWPRGDTRSLDEIGI